MDGERLESQEFPAPAQGGIRLLLVATDPSKSAGKPESAAAGDVVLGGNSRIVIEPGDESVHIYYLLDIVNGAGTPVNTASLFMFDMPTGSVGCSILEGSTGQAAVNGPARFNHDPFARFQRRERQRIVQADARTADVEA